MSGTNAGPYRDPSPAPNVQSAADIARAAQEQDRTVYTYKIPQSLSGQLGTKTVGLVELTADEELMAAKRARNDMGRMAFELARASLIFVDGQKISPIDGSSDRAWNRMHPKIRSLVMTAYGEIHNPQAEDQKSFLASVSTSVG